MTDDTSLHHARLLRALALLVPRPLHFEPEPNEFGQRFFLTPRLAGAPGGDVSAELCRRRDA